MKKLIVFGVLLESKMGAFKDILASLGKEEEALKVEKEYQKRKLTGPWGLEKLAELYRGFSKRKLKEMALKYCTENLRKGTRETIDGLKRRDFVVGAISSDPQFVMDALTEIIPLDFSEGTKLEFKKGIATGRIERKIDRYIKVDILKEKKREYGIEKENVILIGDAITELPMVKEAGVFIAFDAKEEEVEDIAKIIIRDKDLRKIFGYFHQNI